MFEPEGLSVTIVEQKYDNSDFQVRGPSFFLIIPIVPKVTYLCDESAHTSGNISSMQK